MTVTNQLGACSDVSLISDCDHEMVLTHAGVRWSLCRDNLFIQIKWSAHDQIITHQHVYVLTTILTTKA